MIVRNGLIYQASGELVSASEFWNFQKQSGNTLDLKLLGYAQPVITLIDGSESPIIKFQIKSNVGLIDVSISDLRADYIIHNEYWIPTDRELIVPTLRLLDQLNIEENKPLSLGKIYKFISFAREIGIEVIDKASISNYKIDTSKIAPVSLKLPLYEYQTQGVAWLGALLEQEIGGILADEMGLGKTAQAFGLIKHGIDRGFKNILVVAPAALVFNWAREIKKFVPDLPHYLHVGSERIFIADELLNKGVVIVSYDLLVRDGVNFKKIDWDMVICDEAQSLKNSTNRRYEIISELMSSCKFMVTGTPIENRLLDLWSLVNLIRPGLLGNKRAFQALIEDSPSDARRLSNFASPLILRRVVDQVAKDLPEKVVIEEAITGTVKFAEIYDEVRRENLSKPNNVLATITKLSQLCCYPKLIEPTYTDPKDSKILRLLEILSNVKDSGDQKAIVFSTFTESLDLIRGIVERHLEPNYISIIDGRISPKNRLAVIEAFESVEGFAVLCIHPSAGGVGLNITAANHVIHFNRQWNPALEAQATARAYRRGQVKTVFEHLMYYCGTIEEYITETLTRKIELAQEGTSRSVLEGSEKDINAALALSPIFITNTERKNI
jgi:SNF2 family DNA or RNA helicase